MILLKGLSYVCKEHGSETLRGNLENKKRRYNRKFNDQKKSEKKRSLREKRRITNINLKLTCIKVKLHKITIVVITKVLVNMQIR